MPFRPGTADRRRRVADALRGHAFCNASNARGVENIASECARRGLDPRDSASSSEVGDRSKRDVEKRTKHGVPFVFPRVVAHAAKTFSSHAMRIFGYADVCSRTEDARRIACASMLRRGLIAWWNSHKFNGRIRGKRTIGSDRDTRSHRRLTTSGVTHLAFPARGSETIRTMRTASCSLPPPRQDPRCVSTTIRHDHPLKE